MGSGSIIKRRGFVRRTARSAIDLLVSPPLVGAAYVVALAAWSGRQSSAMQAEVGDVHRAEAVEAFIARRFPEELGRLRIGIVATAIGLGLVIGLVAQVLVRLRRPRSRPRPRVARRSVFGALARSALLVAVLHAALVAWGMARAPQLYAAHWYAEGGLRRTAQIVATDWLGPSGVVVLALACAVVYARPALARWVSRPFARLALAAGVFALGAESLGGDRREPLAPAALASPTHDAAAQPNILVLAADSLRADRLEPRVAPNLARLAARGARFDRAYVSLPRTFPSWVTILTGRHAHHHGVRSMFPTWEQRAKDLDALPARLARAGYATAVVSDYAGDIFARVDLGFAKVDTPSFDFRQIIRQEVVERETPLLPVLHSSLGRRVFPVMRELNAAADPLLLAADVESALRALKTKPFFLTAFFSTAHFPYAAPAPYYGKFTDPAYRGRFKYHKPVGLGAASELPPDADDIRQIRALYDGSVSAIDDAIGRVLATLDHLDLARRTIVVVTADHGETLFEDGHGQGHGDHLFGDEGTHVPLVIVDPRHPTPQRSDRIVRDVDLAATLYELAALNPPSDLDGRSLAPTLGGAPLPPALAYAETELWFTEDIPSLPPELRLPYPGVMGLTELDSRHNAEVVLRRDMAPTTTMARHRMVRDERYKLVYVPTRLGVRYLLFDTQVDPGETTDVAARFPAEVARLKTELWTWMLKDGAMEQRGGYLVPKDAR